MTKNQKFLKQLIDFTGIHYIIFSIFLSQTYLLPILWNKCIKNLITILQPRAHPGFIIFCIWHIIFRWYQTVSGIFEWGYLAI